VERITELLKGLANDVRDWTELKLLEAAENQKIRLKTLVFYGVTLFFAGTSLLFFFLASAWLLGDFLGHPWGFLTLSALTALVAAIFYLIQLLSNEQKPESGATTNHNQPSSNS